MGETPREVAQQRANELKELRARLIKGDPTTAEDNATAAERAEEAKLRALKARLSAAEKSIASASARDRRRAGKQL
jgi:hypothetical protein